MTSESKSSLSDSVVLMDYLPKLIRLADRNMSMRLKTKIDSEEMAYSIIGSVLRMRNEGKIRIDPSEDFWRLLVAISLNKVRKKARHYKAKKRDMGREIQFADDMPTLEEIAQDHGDPTDEDGADIAKVLEKLAERLDENCQIVLAGRLEFRSNLEIASQMNKSTRTVSRCWLTILDEMNKLLDDKDIG